MPRSFFKSLCLEHLRRARIKNGRGLVAMVQRSLYGFQVTVFLEKVYCIDLSKTMRRDILIKPKHFRCSLNIFPNRLPRAVPGFPSPGKRPHFPGLFKNCIPQRLRQANHSPLFCFLLGHPKARFYLLRFKVEHIAYAQPCV